MKKVYFLLIIVFSSCSAYRQGETYNKIVRNGFAGIKYSFSDSGNRNIEITFNDDSTLNVINKTNIAQTYYLLNFDCFYSYKMLDIASIKIIKMLSSDKQLKQDGYLKPYDYRQYEINNSAVQFVFPDLTGDTIRFSADLGKLQVREFCFDRIKK